MWFWFGSLALAGDVYINEVRVRADQLSDVELERVSVRFDASGNVYISAPQYDVEITRAAPAPAPASAPGVPAARYWLVTEDLGSAGHTVECWINGERAFTTRSGSSQQIVDVGRWLKSGENEVHIRSTSTQAGGGTLYLYLGTGEDRDGTVVMDDPAVQYGLSADRKGPHERTFALSVP